MNNTDPTGLDSFFIGRPLSQVPSNLKNPQHGFVIVTSVGEDGRHQITDRFSFGPAGDSIDAPLINVTRTGDDTDRADAGYAGDFVSFLNGDSGSPERLTSSQINAPDALTRAVGNAVIGNPDYETVPGLQPGRGANSNSAAVGLARIAAGLAGNTFSPPSNSVLPGAEAVSNLQINREQLVNDVEACRADGSC